MQPFWLPNWQMPRPEEVEATSMASTLTVSRNITQLVHVCAQHKKTLGGICGLIDVERRRIWMREVCCDGSTFKRNERHGNVLDCLEIRKKTKHNWRVSTLWRPEKNLQDRFHILAYRDLSCHRLEAACFSSWHLCSRGTKSWCVSWIRFVKRCGAQHDQGGSMGSIVDLTTAFDFEKEQSRKETCMMASRSWIFSKLLIDQRVCWSSIPWESQKSKGSGISPKDAWSSPECLMTRDKLATHRQPGEGWRSFLEQTKEMLLGMVQLTCP